MSNGRAAALPPKGSDLVGDGPSSSLVQICGHDGRALLSEADGRRSADVARRRASDDGDLVLESSHCSLLL